MMRRLALLAFFAVLSTACGTSKPQPERSQTKSTPVTAANADAEAAAALKTWATGNGAGQRALGLATQAAQREPRRADLAWLHLRLCAQTKGCDPAPLETRLRKLDPDNGVTWTGPLGRAQAKGDARAAEQVLEAMSRSERFDLYWTTLIASVSSAMSAETSAAGAQNPLTTALNDTTSWVSKLAAPALNPIAAACNPQGLSESATLARCRRIAQAMQRSDTTLVEGMGLGIEQRYTTPGSQAAAALDARVEELTYQSQTAGSIVNAQVERDRFAAQMIELMKKLPREQQVSAAILRWAGQPLAPQP